ncbi:hypothetical protein FBU30_001495, partial [Linnemannia zychae]
MDPNNSSIKENLKVQDQDQRKKDIEDFHTRKLYKIISTWPGSKYFENTHHSDYSPEGYVLFRLDLAKKHAAKCCKEYNRFLHEFSLSKSSVHHEFGKNARKLTKKMVNNIVDSLDLSSSDEYNTSLAVDDNFDFDISVNSTTSLSSSIIDLLKNEFIDNFQSFCGQSFTLPSGLVFDEVIRDHVLTLRTQSSMHSFIWDSKDNWNKLFLQEQDCRALDERVINVTEDPGQLPDWQLEIINAFDSIQNINDVLLNGLKTITIDKSLDKKIHLEFADMILEFMKGILSYYEDNGCHNQRNVGLSERSESDYLRLWSLFFRLITKKGDCLRFAEGEISSQASRYRKNFARVIQDRQSGGVKPDGIFYCLNAGSLEIGAIEGGKKNEISFGTKILLDSLKMSKLLKD